MKSRWSSSLLEEFSNPKVKRITFAFVLGNKDDKKVNN